MGKYLIGVDIGGTNLVAGLISIRGRVLRKKRLKTGKSSKRILDDIFGLINHFMSKDVYGIGIGSPGPINLKKGIVEKTDNLPLKKTALREIVKKKFKLNTDIDNDGNLFVLGEALFGAGKDYDNVFGITLGTGIGGGLVIRKNIYHGRSNAGEIGHTTIKFDGIKSKNQGEIEAYIGKKGIMKLAKGLNAKEPLDIYKLAARGNRKALNVWDEFGRLLGISIANMINSFDPDIFVIGGSVSGAFRFFRKSMEAEVKKRSLFRPCKVVQSSLGEDAAIIGAAFLVR